MTPEGNQIGVSFLDDGLGTIRFEPTCSDDSPFKNPTQSRCRNGHLTLCDEHVAFDPRFNDVKVRESELVHSHPTAGRPPGVRKSLAFARHRATRHGYEKQNQETKANEV